MALTEGSVNQNLVGIENKYRNKNIYPFHDFDDYNPEDYEKHLATAKLVIDYFKTIHNNFR